VPQQEWSSYLDALESYLAQASRALRFGQLAPVPSRLASRAASPPEPEVLARVAQLFAQTERLAQRAAARREEVLEAMRSIGGRTRLEARPLGRVVDSRL
jgi:hypothetical protein